MTPGAWRPTSRAAAALIATVALVLGCCVAASSAASEPGSRGPRTYVVNTTADTVDADVGAGACSDSHQKCSLRAAIMQANFHAGVDIIKIPAGRFTLKRAGDDDQDVLGDLDVTDSVKLEGAGPTKTIIDGNGAVTQDRVLQVFPTATDTTITGLTLRGGLRTATFDEGGGLLWQGGSSGHLTLRHVTVSHNSSYDDGGLALDYDASSGDAGRVTVDHVTVQHNKATAAVGGLGVTLGSSATFAMRHSVISANKAYEGAGLYLSTAFGATPSSITVDSTEIVGNHGGLSGAIENHAGTDAVPVVVENSYLHDNVADIYGGGIGNYGVLHVDGSTLEGNTAAMNGGGVYDYEGGLATLTNTTLSANSATDTGGGAYVEFFIHGLAEVRFVNSTLDRNTAATGGGMYISSGAKGGFSNTLIARGTTGANCVGNLGGQTSLSDDNSCGFGGGADNADLKLGPIGWHGGATRTLVPRGGSPAVDTGTVAGEPVIDQRGVARPMGGGLDIGAVEVCPQQPSAPHALKVTRLPKSTRLKLGWKEAGCFETYSVVLRAKSTKGHVVEHVKHLRTPGLSTKKLVKGHTYYWRVTAVGDRGNGVSTWHHITVR